MNKKLIISISVLVLVILAGVGFWVVKNKQESNKGVSREKAKNDIVVEEDQQQNQEEKQKFVIDVDMNIDNWQTKETEFFTIKFPKEWYWLESDREKTGYRSHVITNDAGFDINKYADIGVFTGGDYLYTSTREGVESKPLQLNNTEIVISFNGAATSDVGTPQQSIESSINAIQKTHTQTTCEYFSNFENIPIIANCIFVDTNHQKVQTYFIVNEKNKIFFSVRTVEDNLAQKEIFDKIAKSMILKGPF